MNKQEMIQALSDMTGLSRKVSGEAVGALADIISRELSKGNEVVWSGFGKFDVLHRAGRMGRNPGSGESMYINPSYSPRFRAGKVLKDAVKAALGTSS